MDEHFGLDKLPDDALRCVFTHIRRQAVELRDVMRFFCACHRLAALEAHCIEELELSMLKAPGMLIMAHSPSVYANTTHRVATLLAPFNWARRLSGLRALEISHLSWPGA